MTKIRTRIISILMTIVTLIGIVPITVFAADPYNGGAGYSLQKVTVYTSLEGDTVRGTIFKNEGLTILRFLSDGNMFVQYSTSSGPKKGYVLGNAYDVIDNYAPSCVGKITTASNVYYGNSTSKYEIAGSVEQGEIVAVIAVTGSWAYIEYNTTSGRKRGYIQTSKISYYNEPLVFNELYLEDDSLSPYNKTISGTKNIYSGPSTHYPIVGSVSSESVKVYYEDSRGGLYVRYAIDGTAKYKTGFILN